jgi:hypothetical protein
MKSLGKFVTIILIGAIVLSSFTLISGTQASVEGNIASNTTWIKANSPYSLTGNVTVDSSATLTIESGVTIQMPSDCTLQVNGILVARGTSSEKISFTGGDISLSGSGSGSVIENAILNPTNLIIGSSATINGNTIIGRGSANSFEAVLINDGAPIISNNLIYGADSQRGICITGGSPTISSNGIMGMIISEGNNVGTPIISHNTIEGGIHLSQSGATITNNLITGFKYVNFNGDIDSLYSLIYDSWLGSGISITADYTNIQHGNGAVITDNVITGCLDGISILQGGTTTIQRNIIVNTTRVALHVASDAIISENTIRNNQKAIVVGNAPTLTVKNNNLENNGYNFYLYTNNNIDATNNWWGTNNTQTIENNIYDGKFKQYCGNVTITPILIEPNPEAHPNSMTFPSINMPNSGDSESNPFHIGTNSTVTNVVFNPENATLSFNVSGPSGTAGSTNVTIAKSVMPNGRALKVTMDDKQISYALADNDYSWNLGFTYNHSTHRVTITDGELQSQPTQTPTSTPTSTVNEFNIPTITLFLIITLAVISLIFVGLKRKNPLTPNSN